MATLERPSDPYRGYNFRIEVGGFQRAAFRECEGLSAAQEPIEYREGTDPKHPRKVPGLNKYTNITLKWGISDDTDIWEWRKKCIDGKVERQDGSIILMDEEGNEVCRWNFFQGWPTNWTGPSLNATGNDIAIETLEITHERIEKA